MLVSMNETGEHVWRTRSRHPSQDGVVAYQQCHCGTWRVLLESGGQRRSGTTVGATAPGGTTSSPLGPTWISVPPRGLATFLPPQG